MALSTLFGFGCTGPSILNDGWSIEEVVIMIENDEISKKVSLAWKKVNVSLEQPTQPLDLSEIIDVSNENSQSPPSLKIALKLTKIINQTLCCQLRPNLIPEEVNSAISAGGSHSIFFFVNDDGHFIVGLEHIDTPNDPTG